MAVAGIDLGTFNSPSYIAWLDRETFLLDAYMTSPAAPLPQVPDGLETITHIAVDAPQSLPRIGETKRYCDDNKLGAGTPTQKLPRSRTELKLSKLYKEFIAAGIDLFWNVYKSGEGQVPGLPENDSSTMVMETYPRYIIKRLYKNAVDIPSKRKDTLRYCKFVWGFIQDFGYRCPGVLLPTADQCDAMLCAIAAQKCFQEGTYKLPGIVGLPPELDENEMLIREGFIVSP